MIPYDDLVVALATWRARQGLSVAQPAGAKSPAPPPPSRAPAAARTAPPAAPPRPAAPSRPAAPPQRPPANLDDFDDALGALVEDRLLGGSGGDYAGVDQTGEATAIGAAPEAPSENLLFARRDKRNPDW